VSELSVEVKSFSEDLKFEPVPLLEKAWEMVKRWDPKPLRSSKGIDLTEFTRRIDKPKMSLRMEFYSTDKCEKISLGWFYYMGPRITQVFGVMPRKDLDLPIFMVDLDERKRGSSLILDLGARVDLVAEEWYREKYYDGLAPVYGKYWDLGPQKIVFHPDLAWYRMASSPYFLNIELPLDQRETITSMIADYLEYYDQAYERAEPWRDSRLEEYAARRWQVLAKMFKEKDPAKGVMIRTLGPDLTERLFSAMS
jgi:hypothetical protein